MQAFKEEKTDLSPDAYYCHGCQHTFLGRPHEQSFEGYFDEDGEWVDQAGRYTIAFACDDEPPCPGQNKEEMFIIGTLADLVMKLGISYYIDRNGTVVQIRREAAWVCDYCENSWAISDYGNARAEQRAVHCCQ